MTRSPLVVHFSARGQRAPRLVREFAEQSGYGLVETRDAEEVLARVNRSHPAAIIVDGSPPAAAGLELTRSIKNEAFTSVVPVVVYLEGDAADRVVEALEAGVDEVLDAEAGREANLRLRLALRRAARDVNVHPTTRLPGTGQIARDFAERISGGELFATCYADLDHFKEFNDRYGYNHGDRVILLLSRILRDVVRAHSPGAFVGHIGGDDFIFNLPVDDLPQSCADVLEVFDELIPLQYTPEDRERGYFVGTDRRGVVYQVPIMTLSIGVVTNVHRTFSHAAEIGELATEMKRYAKTLPGSVYAVDRRRDP